MLGGKPSRGRGAVKHGGDMRSSAQANYNAQRSLTPHKNQSEEGSQTKSKYGGEGDEDFFDSNSQGNDKVTEGPEGDQEVVLDDDPNQNHIHTQQHGPTKTRLRQGTEMDKGETEDENDENGDSSLYEMEELMDVTGAVEGKWQKVRENKKRKIDQSPQKINKAYDSECELGVLSPGVCEVTIARSKIAQQEIAKKSNFTGVANSTIRSEGNEKTIIIKAIGANANSFLKDPVGLAKGFKCSTFATVKAEMRVNSRRNVVAVELKQRDEELIKELVKTKRIGRWEVICYQPGMDLICSGVIGPIDKETNLQELQDLMEADGGQTIVGVTRLNQFKGGFKQESLAIRVNFEGKVLPSKIMVGMMAFTVRAYLPPPLRCYRCQRLGHIADGCSASFRCLVCAGNHSIKDGCTANMLKCANCGGQHKANSMNCPFIIKSNEVRSLSITEGISIREAEKLTSAKYKYNRRGEKNAVDPQWTDQLGSMNRVEVEVDFHQSQGSSIDGTIPNVRSYADVTQVKRGIQRDTGMGNFRNIHPKEIPYELHKEVYQLKGNDLTRKENLNVNEITNIIEKVVKAQMDELIIKIGKMLKEIFTLNLQNEGQKQKELLVQSVIRNNIGKEIEEEIVEQEEESRKSNGTSRESIQTIKTNSQRTTARGKNNSAGKGSKTKSQERQRGRSK
jgi:hypothetical protein